MTHRLADVGECTRKCVDAGFPDWVLFVVGGLVLVLGAIYAVHVVRASLRNGQFRDLFREDPPTDDPAR